MDITTIIGTTGAGIILLFFILIQTKKLSAESLFYDVGNFAGGALLLVYAILLSSIPFAILNAVWTLVSLKDIITDIKNR